MNFHYKLLQSYGYLPSIPGADIFQNPNTGDRISITPAPVTKDQEEGKWEHTQKHGGYMGHGKLKHLETYLGYTHKKRRIAENFASGPPGNPPGDDPYSDADPQGDEEGCERCGSANHSTANCKRKKKNESAEELISRLLDEGRYKSLICKECKNPFSVGRKSAGYDSKRPVCPHCIRRNQSLIAGVTYDHR